ncbi:hypothetical protein GCM10020001_067160 [Nonomuraea salmonea]
MLLHTGRADVARIADRIWYPIWDAAVGLDHSVRTVEEAVSVARQDLKAVLGLIQARHVAGDPDLTRKAREAVLAEWRADSRRRLGELREAADQRAQASGELAFLLEPDLKDGRGGLRDVQAMQAVAAAWVASAPRTAGARGVRVHPRRAARAARRHRPWHRPPGAPGAGRGGRAARPARRRGADAPAGRGGPHDLPRLRRDLAHR